MTDHYASGRAAGIREAAEAAQAKIDAAQEANASRYNERWAAIISHLMVTKDAILAILDQDPALVGVKVKPLEWEKEHYGWSSGPYEVWGKSDDASVRKNGRLLFAKGGRSAAQADHDREILSALTPAPVTPQEAARVSEHFHPEQVGIWTQEILEALALHDLFRPETYDDKVVASQVIARELVDIGKAIDTMRTVNRAALRAIAETEEGEG
jgi:hypothetical protein